MNLREPSFALAERDTFGHSIAMSIEAKSSVRKKSRAGLKFVRARGPQESASHRFVRLAQLRKLSECEQVAAVCYRLNEGAIEFLLVQTRGSGRWTFPKGHAESGLTLAQAAAMEAFEEAGVHGRIEETSFAQYIRRKDFAESSTKSAGSAVMVTAYLCEVLRLATPKESNRKRTWFSVKDSRRCLRGGRTAQEGVAFARVIERAVARIRRLHGGTGNQTQKDGRHRSAPQDALQKVCFEAIEYARGRDSSFTACDPRQFMKARQAALAVTDRNRKVIACEVLQFGSQGKRPKALGTGAKNV
jgi:8-oxo-dGTP pyrophosphatase MutT (NUDIX family)